VRSLDEQRFDFVGLGDRLDVFVLGVHSGSLE
jgi:hypothetical protein